MRVLLRSLMRIGCSRALRWALVPIVALLGFWALVPVVQFDAPLSTVILDRDGELLGAVIAADGQWRFGVGGQVPGRFVTALTRFEDRRFFQHPGVDPLALLRAFYLNVRHLRVVSGGSTLTMQVVRLSRKGRPRTLPEKLIEIVLALRLELALSKQQILALHAAYAPFGGNTVGLDAAAWRYFGHDAQQLSWAETAMLAVLPNSPALIHPGRNRDRLREKRDRLLDSLHESGAFDALTLELAKQEPLPPAPRPLPMLAPHLLARIRSEQGPGGARYRTGDESPWVRTSLQADLQRRVVQILQRHRGRLAGNGVHNAAALVLDVETGRVAAYVGNAADLGSAEHGAFVDVVPAARSTGSVLKPLLYAALLEAGEVLPGQLVPDIPTHLGAFHPENFDRAYAGAVPARTALARSLNVPAVRMLRSYGVDRFTGLLRRLGMTTLFRPARHYGLSLILGGAEGSLWDITGIYAGLARCASEPDDGPGQAVFHGPDHLWSENGNNDPGSPPLHAGACYLTLQAMLEVERPGEERAWRTFSSARRVAWKTGTSYGFRDAWAVGVTPRHAVGVWVGNADGEGRPGLTGYSAAAPILFEIHDLLPTGSWFAPPEDDLREIEVCAHSGHRLGPHCQQSRPQLVTRAGLGATSCRFCRLVHSDRGGSWQVHAGCEPASSIRTRPWFVLPPVMEWHYRRLHAGYQPPPPFRADCRAALGEVAAGSRSLSCVYPKEGSQIYVPVELGGSLGRVVVEAAHRDPRASVFWHLDDRYYGETTDVHQMELAPPPGRHRLTLVDDRGEIVERHFTVLGRRQGQRSAEAGPASHAVGR